ncbi:MAG TPA: amylo-alpha-1,6-glucosidase [Acidobacteriota bacterium]|nr:amylo-alpha-1,6-glucosidase [Acidobacteriota bacterium]
MNHVFDSKVCSNLSTARRKEWLETNGIGGFASSTVVGMNTRRYHGLLVAAMRPPVGRVVLLSKIDETLVTEGRAYDLSTNQYPGVVHPNGYLLQAEFRLDPMPVFVFRIGDVVLEKIVFMLQGENSTAIRYRLLSKSPADARLELRPFIAFRDHHSLTHANPALNPSVEAGEAWFSLTPYPGLPTLFVNHNGAQLAPSSQWYYRFQYEEERQRGLDWEEDLFNPFVLRCALDRADACLIASTEIRDASAVSKLRETEVRRRASLTLGFEASDPLVQDLVRAADQFLVRRGDNLASIIAGYPWFTDWGRDAMISLPGLALATRRFEEARRILLAFARHCNQGMLPNRFPDAGEQPKYNTVDAALWFFQAIYALVQYTDDYAFVRDQLYETLVDILRWHLQGTRYGIKAGEDGLLYSGQPEVPLTWMDARVGNSAVTLRSGKPVEIQALWYNALRVMQHLGRRFGDWRNEQRHAERAERAKRSFNEQFWNPEAECLYDCIDPSLRDGSIRPNQIFAVSLPFSMLSREQMLKVVDAVTRELLTPFGLRSLSCADPSYRGMYEGDQRSRDTAYHQGTVWPWLLGPYITARVRAYGSSAVARKESANLLDALKEHLSDAGLGSISEIFDGDAPHAPRGCIAQAWSVGEILRAAVEDLGLSLENSAAGDERV